MRSARLRWLVVLLLGTRAAPAETKAPAAHEKGKGAPPAVHRIELRAQDSVYCLSRAAQQAPYAANQPEAFHYHADREADPTCTFLVGGRNTTECLRRVTSISGVPVAILQRRLRPNRPPGSDGASSLRPLDAEAWRGVNNFTQRVSTAGFLRRDESLIERLVADNDTVLNAKLTHQRVAASLLDVMARLDAHAGPGALVLERGGRRWRVERRQMAGALLRPLVQDEATKKMVAEAGRCDHGWVGAGVQGSPFGDELFASHYFVLTDEADPKTTLTCDYLTPHLIFRYGFYQGGDYRVDPARVIRLLGVT